MNIEDIVIKHLTNEYLSEAEKDFFDEWYQKDEHRKYYAELLRIHAGVIASQVEAKIDKRKAWTRVRPIRKIKISGFLKYSAIIILPLCLAVFLFVRETEQSDMVCDNNDGHYVSNQAILTLPTGTQIVLADTISAQKREEMLISNVSDKEVVYNSENDFSEDKEIYHTLTIPRGGEYKLVLADSTTVWLNAGSSIRFPVCFAGNVRKVELEGEAYFEVAAVIDKPFIVHMNGYDVRVTGTQFNVRNYLNEELATTLVKGGVQIEKFGSIEKLKPGQQAILRSGKVEILEVDVEEQIAWKRGFFKFTQTRLEDIMEELERWYDVEVFYVNQQVKDYHFSALFERSASINEVIDILGKTKKIDINLKGKILTIKNRNR